MQHSMQLALKNMGLHHFRMFVNDVFVQVNRSVVCCVVAIVFVTLL